MAIARCELDGKEISVETGTLARQADGSVVVRIGDTIVLVTATVAAPRVGIDFFPLVVDFEEKMYAAGKIPGVRYIRREGRPSEKAILTARRIDRSIRPLFPEGFRNDVQMIATVLSADPEHSARHPAMLGASAALMISSIPFEGPVGAVRVGRIGDEFIVNPTYEQLEQSDLELTCLLGPTGVVMLEGVADSCPRRTVVAAIEFARFLTPRRCMAMQRELAAEVGKAKLEFYAFVISPEVKEAWPSTCAASRATIQNPEKKSARIRPRPSSRAHRGISPLKFPERLPEIRGGAEKSRPTRNCAG